MQLNTKLLIPLILFIGFSSFLNLKGTDTKIKPQPIVLIMVKPIDQKNSIVSVAIQPHSNQFIYADSIDLSIDHPDIVLFDSNTNIAPVKHYEPGFKEVDVFNKKFVIHTEIKNASDKTINQANLHISFMTNTHKDSIEELITIDPFPSDNLNTVNNVVKEDQSSATKTIVNNAESANNDNSFNLKNYLDSALKQLKKLSAWAQNLINTTESLSMRLLLAFLLGLLMSFTPCIYPVIPITVGILQAQGSKSVFYNFLLSFSYTLGIATTFALFGLTAAFTGHMFGQILVNPWFIIFLVLVLAYLAFSLFGFYEMYIPKIMQQSNTQVSSGGSLISAFLFGAISGSVASPCLSPGLALLLTIVATFASKFLGFILLFAFGVGLSIPLLIIGTFSSSINLLPRSGMWMVEVKKIFGFMLLFMCIYFLSNIIPSYITPWLYVGLLFIMGIYYLININQYDSSKAKKVKSLFGIVLIAISVPLFLSAYQTTFYKEEKKEENNIWLKDYDQAFKQAKSENKKLIIDIGAKFCSICKAIDKNIFGNESVKEALMQNYIAVKVDATDPDSEPYASIKQKYNLINAVPIILIINPENGQLLKKWHSELYETPINEFIQELDRLA